MSVQVNCPACGAAIQFQVGSSMVLVCAYCRSVVARGDRSVENLGKVAELVETDSPLELGLGGKYEGKKFTLTGRAQLGHEAGGLWDEWYAAFADGRWGWLAEAQGRFYLTFEKRLKKEVSLPSYEELEVGRRLPMLPGDLVVAEKAEARAQGAGGEIPYRLEPGQTYRYADLSGPEGVFATLDYSDDTPVIYVGRQVTLEDLGIPKTARARQREARQVAGVHLSCPQCGGALTLHAPDKSERVACPNCGALLDVQQGELKFFKALEPGKVKPAFPMGTVGKYAGVDWTVIGLQVRAVTFDGTDYFWEEYLLYEPRQGFRWLVCSDEHWSFVQSVPPGEVRVLAQKTTYQDRTYKLYQKADARVVYVIGEFYWKVEVGEVVRTMDFIRPPEFLSREMSTPGQGSEVNWSVGTYLKPDEVEQAFGAKDLPRPSTVAPNQPFPYGAIYYWWGIVAGIAFILGGLLIATKRPHKVFEQTFVMQHVPQTPGTADKSQVFFSEPIALKGGKNLRVTARSSIENSWVFLEGDLINEETGLVQAFDLPVEYYHGVDGGESWSEGGREASKYLSALPGGTYTLRLEIQRPAGQTAPVNVRIDQGVARILYWILTLLAVSVIPLCVLVYHWSFEMKRWKDSDYSPYQSSGSSDASDD